jgi:hypothetical protein
MHINDGVPSLCYKRKLHLVQRSRFFLFYLKRIDEIAEIFKPHLVYFIIIYATTVMNGLSFESNNYFSTFRGQHLILLYT